MSTKKDQTLRDPGAAEFISAAHAVLARLPAQFRDPLSEVVLRVDEFATREQLAAVGMDEPWELTGLYEGVPLPERSQWDHDILPSVITLFRQPLLEEMEATGVSFAALVRHVVIHEAGHHFGLSDDDMHALENSVGD